MNISPRPVGVPDVTFGVVEEPAAWAVTLESTGLDVFTPVTYTTAMAEADVLERLVKVMVSPFWSAVVITA
jgi:hypothetical protein